MIIIYADGGCRGNQSDTNIGGWGAVLQWNGLTQEIRGATYNTTNNRMELTSIIEALAIIENTTIPVEVYMDSQYVVTGINQWIYGWLKKGWKTSTNKPVENRDLWEELLKLKFQFKDITFNKCKGHSGNLLNDRADRLANIAMDELR